MINGVIGRSGILAALLAGTVLCHPAFAEDAAAEAVDMPAEAVDVIGQAETGMPALVLPTEDMEIAATQASEGETGSGKASDPEHYLLNLIREQLTDRYVSEEEIDSDRVRALLTGDYIKDYTDGGNPVSFSNTIFDIEAAKRRKTEVPEPTPDPDPIAAPAGVDFLFSPAAIRAMSGMSPDQIEAIALMVEMMNNPDAARAINPQLELKGIPSLSEQDLADKTPEELLAHITSANEPAAPATPPPVVDIGDGRIMALANWEMIVSPDGRVEMSNATIPGSRFEVLPGVVVGQFGRVLEVSVDEGNQFIAFESGDRLEVPHVPLDQGVPALDGDVEMDATSGEILVSGPVMRGDEVLVSEADPNFVTAPASAIRPKARPESLAKKDADAQEADADAPETETSPKSSELTATTEGK